MRIDAALGRVFSRSGEKRSLPDDAKLSPAKK